jgi:hypothetical protein
MARRNPANPRYQKGHELGKTRRSSASAKPKRAAGDSAAQQSSGAKKKKRPSILAPVPADPEYRRWRKIWLGLLVAAIIFSAFAWWQQATPLGNFALAFAYSCIFTAFYVDFTKLRRMRKAAIEADREAKAAGKKGGPKKTADTKAAEKTGSDSDA